MASAWARCCGIIGYIMPAFLELTFPMAVLLGVLMGFGRMSSDQEMTAARACGISLYRLAVPVLIVALGVYAISSYFAFSLRPWANSNLRNKLFELSQTRTSAGLKEKIFNSNFPGLVVYVDEMSDTDSSLKGVMISDARDPHNQNTIIAKRGAMIPDPQEQVHHAAPVRRVDLRGRAAGQRYPRDQLQDLRPERQSRGVDRRRRRGAGRDDLLGAARGYRGGAREGQAGLRCRDRDGEQIYRPVRDDAVRAARHLVRAQAGARRAFGALRGERRAVLSLLLADAGGRDAGAARAG